MSRRNAPRRSLLPHLAIAAVLGLALVGLTQCRTVSDRLTGIDVQTGRLSHRDDCREQCSRTFHRAYWREIERHKAALRACGRDWECRSHETRRFARNLRELIADKAECKHNCYNEGGGTGGR